jgi:uncharacterized circularly permuted ATP-grasp superfamily protein
VPRIIAADEWKTLERGLVQRVRALNAVLDDIYHDQRILDGGPVPAERILGNTQYRAEMRGVEVPGASTRTSPASTSCGRARASSTCSRTTCACPSGVSYMLENRKMMMRLLPELFAALSVRPVQHYPDVLLDNLRGVSPERDDPTVAVMTPGPWNSRTSSTRSSRSRWASSWSRARTCSCARTTST